MIRHVEMHGLKPGDDVACSRHLHLPVVADLAANASFMCSIENGCISFRLRAYLCPHFSIGGLLALAAFF